MTARGTPLGILLAILVLAFAQRAEESEAATEPQYRCPPCVAAVAGPIAVPAGVALGGAAVAGAAAYIATQATVHQPASAVVQNKPQSAKALRLKAWARAYKINGKAIWKNAGGTALGVWRWFKRTVGVANLINRFPSAAAACATAALVTVAVGDSLSAAVKACIGAAAGVYAAP
jgi:hypothetical protein